MIDIESINKLPLKSYHIKVYRHFKQLIIDIYLFCIIINEYVSSNFF